MTCNVIVTSGHVRFSDITSYENVICVTYEALVKSVMTLKNVKRVTDVGPNPSTKVHLKYRHHHVILQPGQVTSTVEELARHDIERPTGFSFMIEIDEWEYFFRNRDNNTQHTFARVKTSTPPTTKKTLVSALLPAPSITTMFETIVNPVAKKPPTLLLKSKKKTLFVRGGGQHGSVVMGAVANVLRDTSFERFAGASFGAAVAALAALHLDILDRLVHVCESLNLGHPDGFERTLDGDVALAFIRDLFPDGLIERTLGELNLELDVVVTRVSDFEPVILNAETAPNVRLVDALRASMGIPFFIGCCEIEGIMYMDGDFTSYTYIENYMDESSVVVGLVASESESCLFNESMLQGFIGHEGSIIEKVKFLFDQFLVWFKEKYSFVGRCHKSYVSIRDPSVAICGGPTGSTTWHLLNFEHGVTTTA